MFEGIKAVAMDVDGVLTDGTVWYSSTGDESKRFCYADITGIGRARRAGIILAFISGESSAASMTLVQRFADKLGVADVYKGCHDKAGAVREFASKHQLQLTEVCFIGDDVQDIPAMEIVGVAAVPANAQPMARDKATFVATRSGGFGVVREILDAVLEARHLG